MSTYDLIIRNGTIATASDVLAIRNGKIVQMGENLSGTAREIDALGKYALSGGIDSHVHISQPSGPGIVIADDFEIGSSSALFGGHTTVMPFCFQERDGPLRETLKDDHAKTYGLYPRKGTLSIRQMRISRSGTPRKSGPSVTPICMTDQTIRPMRGSTLPVGRPQLSLVAR
ncbi:hypothetical protein LPB41_22750 [Thalassospira sp. MA62]|nr:hypothetical protein [Thalassospira sp. MA62]